MKHVILNDFTFNLSGLKLNFSGNGENHTLTLDPCATCELLQASGLIEGFDIDKNGEPVILFTEAIFPSGYGFEFWAAFVKFFPLSYRKAAHALFTKLSTEATAAVGTAKRIENIKAATARFNKAKPQNAKFYETIDMLLAPLEAA